MYKEINANLAYAAITLHFLKHLDNSGPLKDFKYKTKHLIQNG